MTNTITIYRFFSNNEYQYGVLKWDSITKFTLENGFGQKFVKEGVYEIKQRKVLSNLTQYYQSHYKWFDWHLELQDVPDAKYVYMHVGNTEEDTDACILIANTCDLTPHTDRGFIGESVDGFKEFYKVAIKHLNDGNHLFVKIKDIND